MTTRLAIFAALLIAYGSAGLSVHAAQQKAMEPRSDSMRFGQEILLKDQPEFRFSSVDHARLPNEIRSQAENYLAMYLTQEAQPEKDPQCTDRIFTASEQSQNDLVEYRWSFAGLQLRAVQSLNALKVEIPLAGIASVEEAQKLADSIVKLKGTDLEGRAYEIHLHWPKSLSDGLQFSSNPGANILALPSWHERVDASVSDNRLSILIYKKIPQLTGYQDGSKWFQKYGSRNAQGK